VTVSTVSVPSSPVVVFAPSGSDTTGVLVNTGTSVLYLGQSAVTAATGFPLQPGASLQVNSNVKLYAVAGTDVIGTPTSAASAPISSGATAITVASGGASFTQNMIVSIIDGNNTELVTVGAGSGPTSVVVSATAHAHASGVAFGQFIRHAGGSIQVTM